MSGFTKLSSDIVDSSIWAEDGDTCKVWVTLLALSNKDGYVRGSIGWLASKARVSEDCCRAAVVKFCNPDKASRTPSNEGRRLELLEDGFLILNYMAFRNRLSDDPETTASRLRMRKHREINCATERNVTVSYVTDRNKRNTASASVSESVQEGGTGETNGPKIDEIFDAWNNLTGTKKCLLISTARREHLNARLKEKFFVENWKQAMDKIPKMSFCCGENSRGWKADFDWFIRPESVVRIMEGKYENKQDKPPEFKL